MDRAVPHKVDEAAGKIDVQAPRHRGRACRIAKGIEEAERVVQTIREAWEGSN